MNDLIAIDFGTSRTKVAYFDGLATNTPQLMEWKRSGGQSIPSIFYVEEDGKTIHIGEAAHDRINRSDSKPEGFVEVLKREFKEKIQCWRKPIETVNLLTQLFKEVRELSAEIPVFKQRHPNRVCLTVTNYLGEKEKRILTAAARNAGFRDVDTVLEAEAAALAWHVDQGSAGTDLIIVDCGGGTLDLAYLHREKEVFRVNADVPSTTVLRENELRKPIGGYDVDEALLELVISKLPEKEKQVSNGPLLRHEVRKLKEAYCDNQPLWQLERGIALKPSACGIELTDAEIQSTIDRVYISPALKGIAAFITDVEEKSRRGVPPILLVGGSSRLKQLDEQIHNRFKCEVLSWHRAMFAPVLGAAQEKKEQLVMAENRSHQQVAKNLRDIAALIGKGGPRIRIEGEQIEMGLKIPAVNLLTDAADRLDENILQVAVIGVTCAGKTTLINALVGEELLPASIEVNTGAIVKIHHGQNTDAATFVEEGIPRTVTRKEFRDFIQIPPESMNGIREEEPFPLPDRLNKLDYGILPHNNSLTQRGIAIVDTLGVNAGNKAATISKNFLTQADAVIVVLRHSPPIAEADVKLIRHQLHGIDNAEIVEDMFFVVNPHGDIPEDDKQQIIGEILPRWLGPLFGDDTSLFSRRVFFVNAKKALDAQVTNSSDDVLTETGLPSFKDALIAVVESEESRRLIMQNTMSKLLLPTLHEVRGQIADNKALLGKTLEPLQAAKQAFEAQATERNKKAENVLSTLDAAENKIAEKAANHLADHFSSRLAKWPNFWDAQRESGKLKIGLFSLMGSFVSKTRKKQLQENLKKPIEKFFEEALSSWQEDISEHLKPDMVALGKQLEGEVGELLFDLDEIQTSFDVEGDEIFNPRERSKRKAVQMVIGALTLDPNQVLGALRNDSWLAALRRFLVDRIVAITLVVIGTMFFTGPGAIVIIIAAVVGEFLFNHWSDKSAFDSALKSRIGKQLSKTFQEKMPDIQQEVRGSIARLFKQSRNELSQSLQAEIEAVEHRLDTAIAAHSKGKKATDTAKAQLDKIDARINEKFNAISEVVYGHVLTLEEQKQRIEDAEADAAQSENG